MCQETVLGARQIVLHEKKLRRGECVAVVPIITEPDLTEPELAVASAIITEPDLPAAGIFSLCRRTAADVVFYDTARALAQSGPPDETDICDFHRLQDEWKVVLSTITEQFDETFWNFYLEVHDQAAVAVNAAIRGARKAFHIQRNSFAGSKKTLMKKIQHYVNPFFERVTHVEHVDLQKFGIAQKLSFRFLDPAWAWIVAANKLPPEEMQWVPRVMTNVSGERLYGAGVQYGKSFAQAFTSCPTGTFPMLYNVHWDGTSAHGLSAVPVVVGVSNFNGQSTDGHTCVGYLPAVDKKLKPTDATDVKFYIRQQCIGAVLRVLETYATTGIRCQLPGPGGACVTKVLFPRLMATSLDQPEAQLYFGQLNKTSCIHCRRRKGRSAHRKASSQSGLTINTLYNIVEDSTLTQVLIPRFRCL